MAAGEREAVGVVIAAAFAPKYGPALGSDPALAASIAAVVPTGSGCYVGVRDGVVRGVGLLRFHGPPGLGSGETRDIWRRLRARQSPLRAARSMLLLSLMGADAAPDRLTGYISSLAVDPAWQGRGLGAALLDRLEADSRAAGKTRLALHVTDTNAGARRLYERHGFTAQRTEPALFTGRWGYHALIYMVKRLS
jgi:ribosomal protein S18 acetylase RimI-like enzyme